MGKKEKGKRKPDKWYHLAKEQGYRARSAFKLVQLNQKYNFLGSARACIDLCAAPGGWLQVARKFMPVSSLLIGVDLVTIRSLPNVITLQEDITTAKCRTALKNALNGWKADVVLHDGSPNMGAAWLQDAYTQSELVLKSLKLATEFLVPGGMFISKVFRSSDYNSLLYIFNQLFKRVEATKPMASRNTSAEIYVVCQGYLKPDKIDPRLLDPKYVFQELDTGKKPDVFAKQPKRNRQGYEAGNYILFKECSVAKFIEADDPVVLLTEYNRFVFDDDAKGITELHDTTEEIKLCCDDLRVLNKSDFRMLLRWRLKVRNALKKEEVAEVKEESDVKVTEIDEAEALGKQIEDRLLSIEAREKKKLKKLRKKKAKERRKVELGITNPEAFLESPEQDVALFALKNIKDRSALSTVTADEAMDLDVETSESSDSEDEELAQPGDDYTTVLEKYLANQYVRYVERKRAGGKEVTPDGRKKTPKDEEEDDSLTAEVEAPAEDEFREDNREDNPLLVKEALPPPPNQTELWFSQSIFQDHLDEEDHEAQEAVEDDVDLEEEEEDEEEDEEEEAAPAKSKEAPKAAAAPKAKPVASSNKNSVSAANSNGQVNDKKRKRTSDDTISPSLDVEIPVSNPAFDKHGLFPKQQEKKAATSEPKAKKPKMEEELSKRQKRAIEEHFDVVPIQRDFSSDSESETDDYEESDIEDKAVTLALGKKMLLTKKLRRKMEDDAYNRYTFGDEDDLPSWFVDNEKMHNTPQLPITKEEVELMKEKWKAINARPIKKVLEAKARKKHKSLKKMERMKKMAEKIAKSGEMSEKEKIQSIQKLYNKMGAEKKQNSVYIVRKKFHGGRGPGSGKHSKVKIVDPRMKKDKASMARADVRKRGKKPEKQKGKRGKHKKR